MPLTIYKRGKIWHYRGTVGPPDNRRKLRGSCRTEKRADAERFIAEKDAREWKRGFDGPAAVDGEGHCVASNSARTSASSSHIVLP